jgi:excisionase family DNA binding protein
MQMNITDIKEIAIVTSDGLRHEFEIQITKKTSAKNQPIPPKNNGNSLKERFSHERLTAEEVAEYLRLSPWTIRIWARQGRLPCIRESKRTLRFLKSDIEKYERLHTSGRIR